MPIAHWSRQRTAKKMNGMRRLDGHGGWALRDRGRAMEGGFGSWGEGERKK